MALIEGLLSIVRKVYYAQLGQLFDYAQLQATVSFSLAGEYRGVSRRSPTRGPSKLLALTPWRKVKECRRPHPPTHTQTHTHTLQVNLAPLRFSPLEPLLAIEWQRRIQDFLKMGRPSQGLTEL